MVDDDNDDDEEDDEDDDEGDHTEDSDGADLMSGADFLHLEREKKRIIYN